MMKRIKLTQLLAGTLVILMLFSMSACGMSDSASSLKPGSGNPLTMSDTDYSDQDSWLRFGGNSDNSIDVFMIYPTVTFSMEEENKPYIKLDNEMMQEAANEWLAKFEGLVPESANIYAPLYRQLNGVLLDELNNETFVSYTNATPCEDIFAAFNYYLTNINKGERPFILLGHSQGAQLVAMLSTEFLGNEKYYQHNKNLIASYAIGVSVAESQIALNPNLRFSQSKDDTHVVVSWNTTSPGEVASGAYKAFGTWKPDALVTNPISWTTDETLAHASSNKASLVQLPDGKSEMVEGYANAVVDKEHSVLVTYSMDETEFESGSIKLSKYHVCDIAFFYDSIKQNIVDRIAAFK